MRWARKEARHPLGTVVRAGTTCCEQRREARGAFIFLEESGKAITDKFI